MQVNNQIWKGQCQELALLPLFTEAAHSVAVIRHAMDIVRDSARHLNPGQTPLITMDQPLYAICKKIQWEMGGVYGEDRYVCMMGSLYIEMAILKMLGEWLTDSGWSTMLVMSKVTTSGRAEGILNASHVTRARYAHQVILTCFTCEQVYLKIYNVYT